MSPGPPQQAPPDPRPASSVQRVRGYCPPETPSTHEERVRAFWARYAEKVLKSGANPPFHGSLVVRADESVRAHPGHNVAEQSPAEVTAYLAALGQKREVTGWQTRQAADAIRVLLELVGARWVDEVDWAHWQASARDLGPSHPTVARDGAPDAMPFAAILAAHGPILERASAVAGVWGLSLRTEQTYLHRIKRSIGFLGNADSAEKGPGEVAG